MDETRYARVPATATGPAPAPSGTDAGLLTMVVIWAVNFSVIKIGLAELSPLAFNALRFPLAALTVLIILRRRGPIPLPARGDVLRIVALGVLGNVVYQLFFIYGMDRTLAGNASLLLAGTPIVTALLSAGLGHERVGPRVWIGVVATFGGIALVIASGAGGLGVGADTLVGDLTMVGASLAWAAYTVGARGIVDRYGSIPVTAWTLWIGTALLFTIGLPDLAATAFGDLSWRAWASVGFAGALGIGLAYVLWYAGVRRIGNTRTATYSNLVPVVALAIAWWWLGEVPTVGQVAGAAVIIGGVSLARSGTPG